MDTSREVHLVIPMLPRFQLVGGNVRYLHPREEGKSRREDREWWTAALLKAGIRPYPQVQFTGPVQLTVLLSFPTPEALWPDTDNCGRALKGLIDLLQEPVLPPVNAMTGKARQRQALRGYLRVLKDDKQVARLVVERQRGSRPTTELVITSMTEAFAL